MAGTEASAPATLGGIPLKYISLVILTVQNSALTIILHYSRISVSPDKMYSAASAVLANEIFKCLISVVIAFRNAVNAPPSSYAALPTDDSDDEKRRRDYPSSGPTDAWTMKRMGKAATKMRVGVFSSDCWKLGIPACLYVVQNNLQFVAASNLDVPTFQVTYNLKILTTALFSVILLKRRLTGSKWLALFLLAAGVGIVQIQSTAASGGSKSTTGHDMNKVKGLLAVASACMTSGLAGVYFEKVLKGSKADLWIRNIQLSFFSLPPALVPVFFPDFTLYSSSVPIPPRPSQPIFAHFGFWAWAVVAIQVLGGLVTALVIKYSDNILKGFATSLAIILSFIAGVILFEFQVTLSFVIGTSVVVGATYLYNLPEASKTTPSANFDFAANAARSKHFSPSMNGSRSPSELSLSPFPSFPPPLTTGASASSSNSRPPTANGGYSPPTYRRSPTGAHTPDVSTQTFNIEQTMPVDDLRSSLGHVAGASYDYTSSVGLGVSNGSLEDGLSAYPPDSKSERRKSYPVILTPDLRS